MRAGTPAGNGANCGDAGSGFCGGEPSIGVNANSGKVMYAAGVPLQTLRVTFDAATPPNATRPLRPASRRPS